MADHRLWSRYALAREQFELNPSPTREAAAIASYAEFVRSFCPEHAHGLITLLCANLADVRRQA